MQMKICRAGALAAVCCSAIAHSIVLSQNRGAAMRGAARKATGLRSQVVQGLPAQCNACAGSGVRDPFQPTADYCAEVHDECTCCKNHLTSLRDSICQGYAEHYIGKGITCVEGIQAAIEVKEANCKARQAADDAAHEQQKQEVADILGHDPFQNFAAVRDSAWKEKFHQLDIALQNRTSRLGPFDQECAAYSDPSCKDHQELCGNPPLSSGCNRDLWSVENDYDHVNGYHEMHSKLPCFR
mmetsp:Transcript_68673/g.119287  ORF Transcript_68673/g.119287 Transcript_68673/m.119287 type:complete len:241 (+) Transcript_68673:120-842(+)